MRLSESQARLLGIEIQGNRGKINHGLKQQMVQANSALDKSVQSKKTSKRSGKYQAEHGPQRDIYVALVLKLGDSEVIWEKQGLIEGRSYRADIYLPSSKVVIEMDGFAYHRSKDAFQKDRKRQNLFIEHGFVLLRYYNKQIQEELDACIDQIIRVHNDRLCTPYK